MALGVCTVKRQTPGYDAGFKVGDEILGTEPKNQHKLEVNPEATPEQKQNLEAWLGKTP